MYMKQVFETNDKVRLKFSEIKNPEFGKAFKFLTYLEKEVAVKRNDIVVMMDCILYDGNERSEVILARSENLEIAERF